MRAIGAGLGLCALMVWSTGGAAYAVNRSSTSSGSHHGGSGETVEVTNPGNQISATGQGVRLQIQASDSDGGPLAYTAAGLPGGVTISPSGGLVTGTATAASQTSVKVTVTDTLKGASATASFSWTVNAAYDVSYPQCSSTLPAAAGASMVGVNDGIVFSANPCLTSEGAWGSGHGLQLYANTGDPGPAYSSHWPTAGQSSPEDCTTTDQNSTACSYDYGYNAARDSFQDATTSFAGTAVTPTSVPWWLDVETGNSWETLENGYGQTAQSQANDTAALQGEVAGLQSDGVSTVGFYSTSYQWGQITGTPTGIFSNPVWLAGYSSQPQAQSGCSASSFTAGKVTYTQYSSGGFDADYPC